MIADPTYTAYKSHHIALSGNSTTEQEQTYVNLPKNYLINSTSTNLKVENPYGNVENPYTAYTSQTKFPINASTKQEQIYGNGVYNINPKTGYYNEVPMTEANHIYNELKFSPLLPPRNLPNLTLKKNPNSVNSKKTRLQSLLNTIRNKFKTKNQKPVNSIETINQYIQNLQEKLKPSNSSNSSNPTYANFADFKQNTGLYNTLKPMKDTITMKK